jgi:hypothetical protein
MSNGKAQQELTEIVINKEDIDNLEGFFTHFNIDCPAYLKEQFTTYRDASSNDSVEYSLKDQQRLKEELCKAIASSEHALLKDDLFSSVVERCEDIWFHAQFKRDLEETLDTSSEEEVK